MTQMWLLLAITTAGLAGAAFWRSLRPPAEYVSLKGRRGHRADVRARFEQEKAWYPYLLDVLRVLSFMVAGERFKSTRDALDDKLRKAGDLLGLEPAEFLGLCMFSSGALAVALGWSVSMVALGWAIPMLIIGGGMGYALPVLYLEDTVARRMRSIHKELPYVLDTLGISLSAGLTFQQSLERLLKKGEERPSVLLEELKIVHLQIEMGRSLEDAFDSLKDRVPSNFVADVSNAVR